MSDYLFTHGHFDDRHFPTEEDLNYVPKCSVPTCGMCKHFVPSQPFKAISDGREITASSYCKLRASADLPCSYKALDSAKDCPFFDHDCPL